jgi:selenide,water dikinase
LVFGVWNEVPVRDEKHNTKHQTHSISCCLSILRRILAGGLDKMKEAGVALVGGHRIEGDELKYGLSVTGFVHPKKVLTKRGMKPGDRLVLTKRLGTGVINTAIKGGLASTDVIDKVIKLMATLNRDAATVMARFPIHACTDVTGFGLLGHLAEMVVGTRYGVVLRAADIPILPEAIEYAGCGLLPAGAFKNREFRAALVEFSTGIDPLIPDLLFDPQTSGALLICIDEENADRLLEGLVKKGATESKIIGKVVAEPKEKIALK